MGRHADALRNYEEAVRIQKAALGPDHHAVATTLNNMGGVHQVGVLRRRIAAERDDEIAAGYGKPAEGPGVL
jgi:hypothetical protein